MHLQEVSVVVLKDMIQTLVCNLSTNTYLSLEDTVCHIYRERINETVDNRRRPRSSGISMMEAGM